MAKGSISIQTGMPAKPGSVKGKASKTSGKVGVKKGFGGVPRGSTAGKSRTH